MQAQAVPVIWLLVNKALIGLSVAGVGTLLMYPFRKAKKEWASLKASIADAQQELVQQRTNCLATLQQQGDKQIEILGECSETLKLMHLDQKETLGMLKGGRL